MTELTSTTKLSRILASITEDRSQAWMIPIVNKWKKTNFFATSSHQYLLQKAGIPKSHRRADSGESEEINILLAAIDTVMVEEGVLVPNWSASSLEIRRNLRNWWCGLSFEDKKNLKCFGNRVRFSKYINNWRGGIGYEIVAKLAETYNQELIGMGILDSEYVPTKDRGGFRDKNYMKKRMAKSRQWDLLGSRLLESVSDLIHPDSTDEPFIQLKQLFAAKMKSLTSNSGRANYRDGFNHLTKFLIQENISEKTCLSDILDEFVLSRFYQGYIQEMLEQGKLSPSTTPSITSSVRLALKRAIKIKGLNFTFFHDFESLEKGRVTEGYKPFSVAERTKINDAICSDIEEIKRKMTLYDKTVCGEYPLSSDGKIIPGMATIDNAKYLFDNCLNSTPVFYGGNNCIKGEAFLRIIASLEVGLHNVYNSWGVLAMVDSDTLAPFIFRLAQITGINSESILTLNVDDLVLEHPATGKPCLRYWKERSSGQKEYHLDLFKAKLQWLTRSQSIEIVDIFETVQRLTARFREQAPLDIRNQLFLYKSSGQTSVGKLMVVKTALTSIFRNFVEKHNLQDDSGNSTKFKLTRFRPTFVSELIEKGVSIREVQLMLGHRNIETTMGYLDRLDFNRIARVKVEEALKHIHEKVVSSSSSTKDKSQKYKLNEERIVFTTPLGGCVNIFEPPRFIKESQANKDDQPCSQYNKCLSCDNVMLTASHLPELFAMRRDYLLLMQRNRIMDTPYGIVIRENLFLLEEILSPEKSDFTVDELDEGERLSQFVETAVIDGVAA